MISSVMVTVKIAGEKAAHDMELPAEITIKELSPKLLMALKNIESKLFLGVEATKIKLGTNNRYLKDDEVLVTAGVWDGSIITVERVV